MIRFALACGVLAASQIPSMAVAQDMRDKIVSTIGIANTWGAEAKRRRDDKVQGGVALRIATTGKEANLWDVGVYTPIDKPVKAGDKLVLAFWARAESPPAGSETAVLPRNGIQLSSPPNPTLFAEAVTITRDWKLYQVVGKADQDHAAGTISAALQLAAGKQTVDIGPVFVVNMGQ